MRTRGYIPRSISFAAKAIRPRYLLPLFVAVCLVYAIVLHPWMMNWGATAYEREMTLPGDDLVPRPATQFTRAITIHAPAGEVWHWLIQLGQDRAGFYSYDWLENMTGADIHNSDSIRPAWQPRAVGDPVPMAPAALFGRPLGEGTILRVFAIEPGRSLTLSHIASPEANVWTTVVQPVDDQTTRLLIRERTDKTPTLFGRVFGEPAHFVMQSHMMRGIKVRAEGNPTLPTALAIPAHIGWAAAGIVVFALFLALRKEQRLWLLAPVVVALPALALGHDVNAALAAFLSVGITILGALLFGRRWWAPFTNIAAAVMLILLLAPDAYITFGLLFDLAIVLGFAGGLIAQRRASPVIPRVPRIVHPVSRHL